MRVKIDSNALIQAIEKDQYETLWLASFGGGLINYDLNDWGD